MFLSLENVFLQLEEGSSFSAASMHEWSTRQASFWSAMLYNS